jgi:hypothetical protein
MNGCQEQWATLCKEASTEQDPQRLMILVRRILELTEGERGSSELNESTQPAGSSND